MRKHELILLVILGALIYLSSFFSSAETALTTVNRHRLRNKADDGNARAALVLSILERQTKMLTAILIGNNIVNLTASALTTVVTSRLGGSRGIAIGTGILTFIILLFGEITPKTMATINAEKLSLRVAPVIRVLMFLLTPVIALINAMARLILRLLHVDPRNAQTGITQDELRTIVAEGQEEGVIASDEKEMIDNVFGLGNLQARDVMVPRVDVVFTEVGASYEDIQKVFEQHHLTRLPVYENTPDTVVGILNMKDLVLYDHDKPFSVREYLREPFFTHEYKNTTELLQEMRKAHATFSIVLDEYGATVGIITMEDIVEEIVGEIWDEDDELGTNSLRKVGSNEYLADGSYKLWDLNNTLGLSLTSKKYDSIGGYLVGLLDHFPKEGESCTNQAGIRLVAEQVDHNRIVTVHLYLPGSSYDENRNAKR